ncbi:MAG: hypothetical protein AB8G05_22795 [Oligoflexales bacterium]
MKDLCTLSIFLSGQHKQANGWTLTNILLNSKKYPDHSQARYSFLEQAKGVSKINMGHTYLTALHDFFDKVASNRGIGRSGYRLCKLSDVVTPRWIQINITNETWDHVFPLVKNEMGEISLKPLNSLESQVEKTINNYNKRALAFKYTTILELSHAGSSLVEKYFNEDLFDEELKEFDFESSISELQSLSHKIKNPLHWHTDWFTGITSPTSLNVFRWYTGPRQELKNLYIDAIWHIRKGSFQKWWNAQ